MTEQMLIFFEFLLNSVSSYENSRVNMIHFSNIVNTKYLSQTRFYIYKKNHRLKYNFNFLTFFSY